MKGFYFYKNYTVRYETTDENVKIIDGYMIDNDEVKLAFLNEMKDMGTSVTVRPINSCLREWKAHNILYKFGLFKKRTKDTDLNYNESWFRRAGYYIICLLFSE